MARRKPAFQVGTAPQALPSRPGGPGGFEGAEVHAVGGVDAALKAGKWIESGMESVAEGGIVSDGGVEEIGVAEIFIEAFDLVVPELGFDSAESALDPLGRDEGVDQSELVGV